MEVETLELIIKVVYMICFFVIGTLFGSFLTLATYRIPRKQDIMIKRSYCPNCNHNLGFFDLIPVLSYLFLGGKCRYCKQKISIRYLLFEIANGVFFLVTYLLLDISWILLATLVIYIALFLVIGTSVMKRKMELEDNMSSSNKKGVFNVELLVAVFAFIIYYVATIYTTRNYEDTLRLTRLRSGAMNVAINVLEENKGKNFEDVQNVYNEAVNIDNYTYSYNLVAEEYEDVTSINRMDIKKLRVDVSYKYGTKPYTLTFETIMYEE